MRLPTWVGGRRLARILAVLVFGVGAMSISAATADAGVFLGILSAGKPASPPFVFSPNYMTLGTSGATVVFTINVTNLTAQPQTVTLDFNVHHVLTYYGQNVADGQPGQAGITFKPGDAPNTTQQLVGTPQTVTVTFPPSAAGPTTLTFKQTINIAGYFQVDVGQHKGLNKVPANLSAGFTRILPSPRAQPTLTTTPNPASATVCARLKDTATLSGGQSPTGSITFKLYDPKQVVADVETVGVTAGNGGYATPSGHVACAPGIWHWKASYSGDANNLPAAGAPESVSMSGGGAVLADTGSTPPADVVALLLIAFGAMAIAMAVVVTRSSQPSPSL